MGAVSMKRSTDGYALQVLRWLEVSSQCLDGGKLRQKSGLQIQYIISEYMNIVEEALSFYLGHPRHSKGQAELRLPAKLGVE